MYNDYAIKAILNTIGIIKYYLSTLITTRMHKHLFLSFKCVAVHTVSVIEYHVVLEWLAATNKSLLVHNYIMFHDSYVYTHAYTYVMRTLLQV